MTERTKPHATLPAATPTKAKREEISPQLRIALESMVHEGLELDAAARKANMTTRGVRMALSRPHVLRYLKRTRADFISEIRATNPRRLRELRDQQSNPAAGVRAAMAIEQLGTGDHLVDGVVRQPGFVIVIGSGPPQSIGPVIEHEATDKPDDDDENGNC